MKTQVITYSDFLKSGEIINDKKLRQIDYYLNECGTYADVLMIRKFLNELTYPICFFDFESMSPVIPMIKGTKPNQQILFQYSLHYIEKDGATLQHKEFLTKSGEDPRRSIAEA